MASDRLRQVQNHLDASGPVADPSRIDGQVVLITGGAQGECQRRDLDDNADFEGIGRATAVLLAQKGAKLAINDLDSEKAQDAANEIRSAGGEAEAFPGNALDESFPQKLVDAVIGKFGQVNCLINNAGMY